MSYQQITVVGYVGADPREGVTQSGLQVANFNVAVSKKFKGKDGQTAESTTWFKCTAWRELAAQVLLYVRKGSQVLVTGEVAVSSFKDKAGNLLFSLDLTADTVRFLSSKLASVGNGQAAASTAEAELSADLPF